MPVCLLTTLQFVIGQPTKSAKCVQVPVSSLT